MEEKSPDSELEKAAMRFDSRLMRRSSTYSVRSSDCESVKSLRQYHPRRRLSLKFESLDYNPVESQKYLQEQQHVMPRSVQAESKARWFINFLVGVYVAFVAVLVATAISAISSIKFWGLYNLLEDCTHVTCLLPAATVWIVFNCVLVALGSYLVTYHAPLAAGSGIPHIKCYLNGIKLPGLLGVNTLIAKAGGVVLSVCGGLACGKEGPMIHSGGICGSCLARGEAQCCGKSYSINLPHSLKSDEERRDFVAAGAASGVSAAFGAPIGGVLFSLEEGASYINQSLTWRMLFSSATASLVLNIMMSAIKGHPEDMSNPGLVSFGYVGDVSFRTWELPIFMLMAVFGGLSGALFIQINFKNTLWRIRNTKQKWIKVVEAVVVAACSAVVLLVLIYAVPDCQPIRDYRPLNSTVNNTAKDNYTDLVDMQHARHLLSAQEDEHESQDGHPGNPYGYHGHGYVIQGFCEYGEENRMAKILFGTPEGGLHTMLHGAIDEWSYFPLLALLITYHLLATWTYGLSVSSGVFIPSLLIGAVWGRIMGMIVLASFPEAGENIGKYTLIGAACQLGGTVRMTISLAVIVIECTGDITFGIPIMLSLLVAKWMGDYFNPGIYDLHIEVAGIPLLPWEPPEMTWNILANEVMSSDVVVLRIVERIGRICRIVQEPETSHNGFPVVEGYDTKDTNRTHYGYLRGFILKRQLLELLGEELDELSEEEMNNTIDLRMHMDQAPYSVQENISLPRVFNLFRGVGLRHLMVVNQYNQVKGVITRVNLARFRGEVHKGKFKLEQLELLKD